MTEEKHASICTICLWRERIVEVRGDKELEYLSCALGHSWFKKVTNPQQCRAFNPVALMESE